MPGSVLRARTSCASVSELEERRLGEEIDALRRASAAHRCRTFASIVVSTAPPLKRGKTETEEADYNAAAGGVELGNALAEAYLMIAKRPEMIPSGA